MPKIMQTFFYKYIYIYTYIVITQFHTVQHTVILYLNLNLRVFNDHRY